MERTTWRRRAGTLTLGATLVTGVLALGTGASAAPADIAPCAPTDGTVNAEEELLEREVPRRILAESGLDVLAADFADELCGLDGAEQATEPVRRWSQALWRDGVAAARSVAPHGVRDADDRPLYWARLSMTAAVRLWGQARSVPQEEVARLIADIDRISRGQDDLVPQTSDVPVVVVTGFDPFFLDAEPRRSNPSGATALALDGTTVSGPDGPVRVEAALFPVRWRDFADGMVERALAPALGASQRPRLFFTVSQGRSGFDLEAWNGAWRGGTYDNELACSTGVVPIAADLPTVTPQPQWTRSTLPRAAMAAATQDAPFPVTDNTAITQVPADTPPMALSGVCGAAVPGEPQDRPDGPDDGALAREGGGGDYLSNEIAYRATLLRDALGLTDLPGGHVHTPILGGLDPTSDLTSATFLQDRRDIIAQTTALLEAALAEIDVDDPDQPAPDPAPTPDPTVAPSPDPSGSDASAADPAAQGTRPAAGADEAAAAGRGLPEAGGVPRWVLLAGVVAALTGAATLLRRRGRAGSA